MRVVVRSVVLVAFVLLAVAPGHAGGASQEDLNAIEGVVRDLVAAFNSHEFQAAGFEERGDMIRRLYHFEDALPRGQRNLFFGPLTHPVARGASEHLANANTNFEWFLSQGFGYGLRIDEMQILADTNLAVVNVVSRNWFTSPDGDAFAPQFGRGTVTLQRIDELWAISGIHGSMNSDIQAPDQQSLAGCGGCSVDSRLAGASPDVMYGQRPTIDSLETLTEKIRMANPDFRPPAALAATLEARAEARNEGLATLAKER